MARIGSQQHRRGKIMQLWSNAVGKKILMAITGFGMLGFVIVHLLGNSSIFIGPDGINAYAMHLHSLPPLVWSFRSVMLALFSIHVFLGIQLTLQNSAAKPEPYAIKKSLCTTFAAKNMIWTGVLIGAFLVYHLLHFTAQITNPEISSDRNLDAMGRPDVFKMVVLSFQQVLISLIYCVALIALALHLTHGIQSCFQTVGLNNEKALPLIVKAAMVAAVILFLGYLSIPTVILTGILKG